MHAENYGVYGARKVWLQLNREGIPVARCTVERLMRELGLAGARPRQGQAHHHRRPDRAASRPTWSQRRFDPPAPNRLWVADFTYVPTWSGLVYVAFVIDAYARRILGWRAATTMTHPARPRRARAGHLDPPPRRRGQPHRAGPPQRRRCKADSTGRRNTSIAEV